MAGSPNNLTLPYEADDDDVCAEPLYERSLAIYENLYRCVIGDESSIAMFVESLKSAVALGRIPSFARFTAT